MKRKSLYALLILAIAATGCSKDEITQVTNDPTTGGDVTETDFDRVVTITYNGNSATVTGNGDDQTVSVSGAGVTIVSGGNEIVDYHLSGNSSDGFLKIYSPARQAVSLDGVTLTNPNGAAINLQGPTTKPSGGKTTYLVISGTNTLADGSSYGNTPDDEDEKAVIFSEGDIVVSGTGNLEINASGKSGMVTDDDLSITGGTLSVNVSSAARVIDGDTLKPACLKGQDSFSITGGTLVLTATGTGAKGISGDGTATFAGGSTTITVSGANFGNSGGSGWGWGSHSSNGVSAKGIKFDGNIDITGGTLTVKASKHEGIETKGELTISGGQIYSYSASDDAINSSSTMTISGGYVMAHSGGNDGLDANGNLYIKGGFVYAIGSTSPEVAIDANTEGGYKLYVEGGTIVAIGSLERGSQLSQSCYSASSWSKNSWYAITVGDVVTAFKTPSSGGSRIVVSGASQPSLQNGVTVGSGTTILGDMVVIDATVSGGSSVSLSTYNNNSGGGPWGAEANE